MFALKKRETNEEAHVKMVAYTIILYISSLFVPFVIVSSFQSMVYYSKEQWFFSTPFSAYISFMIGMLLIAVVCTIYLIFREKWRPIVLRWLTGGLIIITIPVFILSLTNYYYLDEKGIHYNSFTSLKEKEYNWKKVATLHKVYRNHQGTTSYYQFKFEMKDGSILTLPYDDKFSQNMPRIDQVIQKYNIAVKDNFNNPIVD